MRRLAFVGWFALGSFVTLLMISSAMFAIPRFDKITKQFSYGTPARPNPLMGYAPWATEHEEEITVPFSLVYIDMTWREIEPAEGIFDFTAFEKRTQLAGWRLQGKRFVFRFLMDVPRNEEHLDIPDWLYEKIEGDGDRYSTSYGKGFSPNYANPTLITAHSRTIQAIAERYDGDRIFPFIELGSLGHWGEWHIKSHEGLRTMPPRQIRDLYLQHYLSSFQNAKLLTRRPFYTSLENDLGLFNDMYGSSKATQTWLGWIQNGGVYDQTGEIDELVPMQSAYLTSPIGGETTGSISEIDLFVTSLPVTIEQFEQSHASFIGPGGYANPDANPLVRLGQLELYDRIGYQFYVASAQYPKTVWLGDTIHGWLELKNTGIAPFYFSWPVQILAEQSPSNRSVIVTYNPDLNSIFPGDTLRIPFDIPIDSFEDGIISLSFSIVDPMIGLPGINLANSSADFRLEDSKILQIGNIELKRPIRNFIAIVSEFLETRINNNPEK